MSARSTRVDTRLKFRSEKELLTFQGSETLFFEGLMGEGICSQKPKKASATEDGSLNEPREDLTFELFVEVPAVATEANDSSPFEAEDDATDLFLY